MKSKWVTRILFFAGLFGLWEGLARLGVWPPYLFPSPIEVLGSMREGFADSSFPIAIGKSLGRLVVGYGISLAIGLPLGLALGRLKPVQDSLGPLVMGLQALPSVCWLPLALLWFGLSESAILFVVIMGAVFSISLSTADGVKNTPPLLIGAAKTLGAEGIFFYRRVVFPAALPSILSGMKLGWTFAWRSLMAGELLYVSSGLGQLLAMGRELNDMARVLAVMAVIVALGLAVDRLVFKLAESRLRDRWGLAAR